MRILLLGPPGAGKGTLGRRLAVQYGIPHVAAGDIIRQHIAEGTEFGQRIEAQIAAGNFAPDADIIYWAGRRLAEPDARQGYILDGFPRDLAQAQAFDTQPCNAGLDIVLEMQASDTILVERLAGRRVCPVCGRVYHLQHCPPRYAGHCDAEGTVLVCRPDDSVEAVHLRLAIYEKVTTPLRGYYATRHLLTTLNAGETMDGVYALAVQKLRSLTDRLEIACAGV